MFPTNLHKNILQLDRQISLLESECKNIDLEKSKRGKSIKQPVSKCSKVSSLELKSPPVKDTSKKPGFSYDGLKVRRKLTSPVSPRMCSTSSLPSNISKVGSNRTSQRSDRLFHWNKNKNACSKYIHCNEDGTSSSSQPKDIKFHLISVDDVGDKKVDVVHREVLFSNPGETIELTVTRTSNADEKNDNFKKLMSVNKEGSEKNEDSCKCLLTDRNKGQKWSEILGSAKRKDSNCDTFTFNQGVTDENDSVYQSLRSISDKVFCQRVLTEQQNNKFEDTHKEIMSLPEKPVNQPEKKEEKEIQCSLGSSDLNESKIFQMIIARLGEQELKTKCNLPKNKTTETLTKNLEESDCESFGVTSHIGDLIHTVKNLKREKQSLSEELAAKNRTIETMKEREEEYLSVISGLKVTLEKNKESAKEGVATLKELNMFKAKLLDQVKISEALKKSHVKMQKILEKFVLENDKLKTQVQIYKLESQKHDVLLAGKEAEIKRYREEIENFQRQISDHLASLKSSAQAIDVEKMMEAIMQQSQLFIQTDSDSNAYEKEKDSSKQNGLMHSSPTSTKTSLVNSSWKQISSIRETERVKSGPDDENSNLDEDDNEEKEFFQVYGENMSSDSVETDSGEKAKKTSFTSCLSMREDLEEAAGKKEEMTSQPGGSKNLSSQKIRSSIDELLKEMKLKWSQEIHGASPDNLTIDDFLNGSQISSI